VLALWVAGKQRGFDANYWATYRQWESIKAQVRKRERGSLVVFYKEIEEVTDVEDHRAPAVPPKSKLVARASWVFNAEQVDGWRAPQPQKSDGAEARANAEAFIAASRADIRHGGCAAYYDPTADYIAVPRPEQFIATATTTATEAYYSVVLHELTHWTGAAHRLARNLRIRFGDHAYAMEELIAEFGAAFLCADLQIANEPRQDHAAYVASWLRVLKDDRAALFSAASKASVAATYLADMARRKSCNPVGNKEGGSP
jgi:antirestriction protein ArdC